MLLDSAPRTWTSIEELHLQFSRALLAHGMQPVLVFSEPLGEELTNRFRATGAEVEAINYENGIFHYYRELRKVIRKYCVGAVHIAFFNYFHLIPWLARLSGVRHIAYQECNSGMLQARGYKIRLIRFRTRVITMPVTRVVAISEFIRQQLIEIGIPEHKPRLAYHGVDMQRFSPDLSVRERWARRYAIQPEEVILSSIAHMRPFKHPEVIVEAFALLVNRGVKARLFMAGNGKMQPELEELSRRLGISERIHWLGGCSNPERLLQATDIFVLASVGEAFGLVLTEAMACGVPVVGSRSGAIPEIVDDGKTGLLAAPQDPASFADAMERLARDQGLRREMGLRGLERVREHFTTEASIERMINVYESMWTE